MNGSRIVTFIWLLALTIVLMTMFKDYHFVDPALYDTVVEKKSKDALDVAAQLGRFDLVSMLLGIIALLIGIMAVSGFWMIRGAAVKAAEDAAVRVAEEVATAQAKRAAEAVAQGYLAENVPRLVQTMVKSYMDTAPSATPNAGLSPEQVQEVTEDAKEIDPNQNG